MNVDASWLKAAREEARRIAEEVPLNDAWRCMTMHCCKQMHVVAWNIQRNLHPVTLFCTLILIFGCGLIWIESSRLKLIFEGATRRGKKISRGGWDQFWRSAGVPWGHVAVFAKPARVTQKFNYSSYRIKELYTGWSMGMQGFQVQPARNYSYR